MSPLAVQLQRTARGEPAAAALARDGDAGAFARIMGGLASGGDEHAQDGVHDSVHEAAVEPGQRSEAAPAPRQLSPDALRERARQAGREACREQRGESLPDAQARSCEVQPQRDLHTRQVPGASAPAAVNAAPQQPREELTPASRAACEAGGAEDAEAADDAAEATAAGSRGHAGDGQAAGPAGVPAPGMPSTLSLAASLCPRAAPSSCDAGAATSVRPSAGGTTAAAGAVTNAGAALKPGPQAAPGLAGPPGTPAGAGVDALTGASFTSATGLASGAPATAAPADAALPGMQGAGLPPNAAVAAGTATSATGLRLAGAAPDVHHAALAARPFDAGFGTELGAQLRVLLEGGLQQAELRLNPQDLGPIHIQLNLHGQQAAVDFSAAHATTREAISHALPALAEMLSGQGLTLGQTSVSAGTQHGGGEGSAAAHEREAARQGAAAARAGGVAGAGGVSAQGLPMAPRRVLGMLDLYA